MGKIADFFRSKLNLAASSSETIHYSGKAPDIGAVEYSLSADVAGALASAKSALGHLLASAGYKTARKQNPKDAVFYTTEIGKCELDIKAAITKLGG